MGAGIETDIRRGLRPNRSDRFEHEANEAADLFTGGRGASSLDQIISAFAQQFDTDLSAVQIHTDADSTTGVAKRDGLTLGNDIYLSGAVDPTTPEGHFLIAHELTHVLQQRGGSQADSSPEGLTLSSAPVSPQGGFLKWAKKKLGIGRRDPRPEPGTPDEYTDAHLARAPEALGGETANQVYRTTYRDENAMDGETSGFFKPDERFAPARNAVGASRLANGLGLSHLIPETRYAEHRVTPPGGAPTVTQGAVSKAVGGEALNTPVFDTDITERVIRRHGADTPVQEILDNEILTVHREGRFYTKTGDEVNDIDLSRPNTQRQLNHLQWFDALIGNVDRHGGNILVDPETGNVSGIDNDLSFRFANQARNRQGEISDTFTDGADDKYLGLPSFIDGEMAEKLLILEPDRIRELLQPEDGPGQSLSDEDVEKTIQRLEVIKERVQGMWEDGNVYMDWDDETFQAQINEDTSERNSWQAENPSGTYLQRQHRYLEDATDPNNPNYWRPGRRALDTTPPPPPPPPVQAPVPQTGWVRAEPSGLSNIEEPEETARRLLNA